MKPHRGVNPPPPRGILMTYQVYLAVAGGKKIWINKTFRTKTEAQKELKSAIKELESVVRIMDSGIVSDAPPKTKPASKSTTKPASKSTPKSAPKEPRSRPVIPSGLTVLRFKNEKGTHLVGIAPAQLTVVKQTFTSMKYNYAYIVVTSRTMTITAIDNDHVGIVRLDVPIYSGSNLRGTINPARFDSSLIYVTDDDPARLDKIFQNFDLRKGLKAQGSAKALKGMISPYSTGKQAKFYRIRMEIGSTSKAIVTDGGKDPVSTAVPLKRIGGNTASKVTSQYQVKYFNGFIKVFGTATVVFAIQKNNNPVSMGGVNKGVKILFILAPIIDNE